MREKEWRESARLGVAEEAALAAIDGLVGLDDWEGLAKAFGRNPWVFLGEPKHRKSGASPTWADCGLGRALLHGSEELARRLAEGASLPEQAWGMLPAAFAASLPKGPPGVRKRSANAAAFLEGLSANPAAPPSLALEIAASEAGRTVWGRGELDLEECAAGPLAAKWWAAGWLASLEAARGARDAERAGGAPFNWAGARKSYGSMVARQWIAALRGMLGEARELCEEASRREKGGAAFEAMAWDAREGAICGDFKAAAERLAEAAGNAGDLIDAAAVAREASAGIASAFEWGMSRALEGEGAAARRAARIAESALSALPKGIVEGLSACGVGSAKMAALVERAALGLAAKAAPGRGPAKGL